MLNNKVGIMQGRLTNSQLNKLSIYPKRPFDEIKIAKQLNFYYIEFLTKEDLNKDNLIWSDKKIKKLNYFLKKNKLKKISFIDNRSIKINLISNFNYYKKLINRVSKAKFKIFIIPLIGKSEINLKNMDIQIRFLKKLSKLCTKKKLEFLVETDLSFKFYKKMRKKLPKNFGLVFDTGNRYIKYKNRLSDILKFNKEIKHVHLKDRDNKGKNVLIGKGLVDFAKFFKNLNKIKYKGHFTLESTRGKNAKNSIISNLNYLKNVSKK